MVSAIISSPRANFVSKGLHPVGLLTQNTRFRGQQADTDRRLLDQVPINVQDMFGTQDALQTAKAVGVLEVGKAQIKLLTLQPGKLPELWHGPSPIADSYHRHNAEILDEAAHKDLRASLVTFRQLLEKRHVPPSQVSVIGSSGFINPGQAAALNRTIASAKFSPAVPVNGTQRARWTYQGTLGGNAIPPKPTMVVGAFAGVVGGFDLLYGHQKQWAGVKECRQVFGKLDLFNKAWDVASIQEGRTLLRKHLVENAATEAQGLKGKTPTLWLKPTDPYSLLFKLLDRAGRPGVSSQPVTRKTIEQLVGLQHPEKVDAQALNHLKQRLETMRQEAPNQQEATKIDRVSRYLVCELVILSELMRHLDLQEIRFGAQSGPLGAALLEKIDLERAREGAASAPLESAQRAAYQP